jgi:Family of unknown function (DUF5719)
MRGLLRALAVAAVGSGLVAGATHLPGRVDVTAATVDGALPPARPVALTRGGAVCPGPQDLGVTGLPAATTVRQRVDLLAAAPPAAALPAGTANAGNGTLAFGALPGRGALGSALSAGDHDRGSVLTAYVGSARSAVLDATGTLAPGVVALQRSLVNSGDGRGLITTACGPAAGESWLLGGGAQPGRRERVVLTNPGPNPVTVDLSVLGTRGPVPSPNGRGIVVAPYGRTVVLLDAIAGQEASPVLHVVATGGEVAAVLDDTWLDGVIPRGGDDATPAAAPAREQVIPAFRVGGPATVRVAVPGADEAVVQTRVLTPTGPRPIPRDAVVRVAGQSSRDIDVSALPAGAYAVQVRADVPVVAAAMTERRRKASGPSDLAWATSTPAIGQLAGSVLRNPGTKGVSASLDLAATGGPGSAVVTVVDTKGRVTTRTVAVPADGVAAVPLAGATSVWVHPAAGTVRAGVTSWKTDPLGVMLSSTPLLDQPLTELPMQVREQQD